MDLCQWLPGKGDIDKGGRHEVKLPIPAEPPKIKLLEAAKAAEPAAEAHQVSQMLEMGLQ